MDKGLRKLSALLRLETPYSLETTVRRLRDAAAHLLRDHGCDAHGYECVGEAINAATDWLEKYQAMVREAAGLDTPGILTCCSCGLTATCLDCKGDKQEILEGLFLKNQVKLGVKEDLKLTCRSVDKVLDAEDHELVKQGICPRCREGKTLQGIGRGVDNSLANYRICRKCRMIYEGCDLERAAELDPDWFMNHMTLGPKCEAGISDMCSGFARKGSTLCPACDLWFRADGSSTEIRGILPTLED